MSRSRLRLPRHGAAAGSTTPSRAGRITARLAMEFGREVYGVPGNATQLTSFGPNQLIKQGAERGPGFCRPDLFGAVDFAIEPANLIKLMVRVNIKPDQGGNQENASNHGEPERH